MRHRIGTRTKLAAALIAPVTLAALAAPTAGAASPHTAAPRSGLAVAALAARLAAAQPAGATAGGLSVFVGYAEDKEINTPDPAAFPVPWAGSPNTTFLGGTVPGQTACGTLTVCYDAGAIRLDNNTAAAIPVSSVSADIHSSITGGKLFSNLWGSFTVPAGQSVILTENPPANNPGYDNSRRSVLRRIRDARRHHRPGSGHPGRSCRHGHDRVWHCARLPVGQRCREHPHRVRLQ